MEKIFSIGVDPGNKGAISLLIKYENQPPFVFYAWEYEKRNEAQFGRRIAEAAEELRKVIVAKKPTAVFLWVEKPSYLKFGSKGTCLSQGMGIGRVAQSLETALELDANFIDPREWSKILIEKKVREKNPIKKTKTECKNDYDKRKSRNIEIAKSFLGMYEPSSEVADASLIAYYGLMVATNNVPKNSRIK